MKSMTTLKYDNYTKIVVLKVDDFSSEIIDEQNFALSDTAAMQKFKHPYIRRDDCFIAEIPM